MSWELKGVRGTPSCESGCVRVVVSELVSGSSSMPLSLLFESPKKENDVEISREGFAMSFSCEPFVLLVVGMEGFLKRASSGWTDETWKAKVCELFDFDELLSWFE